MCRKRVIFKAPISALAPGKNVSKITIWEKYYQTSEHATALAHVDLEAQGTLGDFSFTFSLRALMVPQGDPGVVTAVSLFWENRDTNSLKRNSTKGEGEE